MSEVSPKAMLAFRRRMKKVYPTAIPEFHRLENAKNILAETKFALKQAEREMEAAQRAWDNFDKE